MQLPIWEVKDLQSEYEYKSDKKYSYNELNSCTNIEKLYFKYIYLEKSLIIF